MRRKPVSCGLCKKKETWDAAGVCDDCRLSWEQARRTNDAARKDREIVEVMIYWYPEMKKYYGDVEGPVSLHWSDLAQAMGAVSVPLGANSQGSSKIIRIGFLDDGHGSDESHELVRVNRGRAEALQKIIQRFFNGLAKAYAKGLVDGSNLLRKLATGEVTVQDFTETREAAKMQRKRRKS